MEGELSWELDPAWVRTESGLEVRFYHLLTMLAYGLAAVLAGHFAERGGVPPKRVSRMIAYSAVAAALGGHLAHLALYEPESLGNSARLVAIGSGLASHGAALAALFVAALLALRDRRDPRVVLDAWITGMVATIPFVRLGNLTNSELVGRPSEVPWAITFPRYDCPELAVDPTAVCADALARHPWPIYDALDGIALTALALVLHARGFGTRAPGTIFVAVWTSWMTARFVLGFLHEHQASSDASSLFTVEQLASVGSLALGLALFAFATHLRRRTAV